jgi:hypothetical protein
VPRSVVAHDVRTSVVTIMLTRCHGFIDAALSFRPAAGTART